MKEIIIDLRIGSWNRRFIVGIIVTLIAFSSACFAVPLGGKGSTRKESIKGTIEVIGTFSVDGRTVFNGKNYIWPKTKEAVISGAVLKNDGKGNLVWAQEVSPSGDDGALQLSENGSFSSDKNLAWNKTEKSLYIGGTSVSLSGHIHNTADIKGILPVTSGGTGTDDGSINATTVGSAGPVRSETGFNVKGADGTSGTYTVVSDMKLENNSLKKKIRQLTVSGGIITAIGAESDWTDAGSVILPAVPSQPAQQ